VSTERRIKAIQIEDMFKYVRIQSHLSSAHHSEPTGLSPPQPHVYRTTLSLLLRRFTAFHMLCDAVLTLFSPCAPFSI
jgi:hypothetical protein